MRPSPPGTCAPISICDSNWLREALLDKSSKPRLPGWRSRDKPVTRDERRYKRHHRIKNVFSRLKDRAG